MTLLIVALVVVSATAFLLLEPKSRTPRKDRQWPVPFTSRQTSSHSMRRSGGDCVDPIRPALQRRPHFIGVPCPIINPRNARTVAADVVQDGLDDVWQHAEFGHHRCCGAPKIVQSPIPYRCR